MAEETAVEEALEADEAHGEASLEARAEKAEVREDNSSGAYGKKETSLATYRKIARRAIATGEKKSTAERSELESAVENAKHLAKELGVDETESISHYLSKHAYPSEDPKRKGHELLEVHDSLDGAHALVYHKDPRTGMIYIAFEKKPEGYPDERQVGKLSLYGGSIKISENPNEGLARELKEEDPRTHSILIDSLNATRWKVSDVTMHIDGVPSTTYVWAAEIKDPGLWQKYAASKTTEGDKTIISIDQIAGMKTSDFAFGFGPVVKEISGILPRMYSKNYDPGAYKVSNFLHHSN